MSIFAIYLSQFETTHHNLYGNILISKHFFFILFYFNDTTLHKGYLQKVAYKRLLTKGFLQKVTYRRLLTEGYLQKVTYRRLLTEGYLQNVTYMSKLKSVT